MTSIGIDGLPVRMQGLLVATADGFYPDWVLTWGESRRFYSLQTDPVKGTISRSISPVATRRSMAGCWIRKGSRWPAAGRLPISGIQRSTTLTRI